MRYLIRSVDTVLDEYLAGLAAVALEGPKGVGKTVTAARRARTVWSLDDPAHEAIIAARPGQALEDPPVLIDEWQLVPSVWDAVRRAVDGDAAPGSFLLTGSATAPQQARIHSGAGRIVSLRMRPMALQERGTTAPTVMLRDLLVGDRAALAGATNTSLAFYAEEIARSGFPGIAGLPEQLRRVQLDSYLQRVMSKEVEETGEGRLRRPASLAAWLRSFAAAEATTTSWEKIRAGAAPGEGAAPSRSTTIRYRDWLTSLWLLDPVEPWLPLGINLGALATSPRHHLADPALSLRLLGGSAGSLLRGRDSQVHVGTAPLFGRLFEALATLSVRVSAQQCGAEVAHLRTKRGDREIDLIVTGPDGEIVAVEVKLTGAVGDDDVRHLTWLQSKLGTALTDAIIVTTGQHAYRRPDGIGVVPLALLG
ncbi:ATP-binding protein [Arachnia propionica]|uniref:ATP-binding protein n=1 Tax=Arachnia propionica TaxID=1750 RepID=A0A3P1T1F7_9ACTN|nr:AAA family ATPase [Arachnia propionica]RRD03327.1 ATP-binding protein [Arachnia propionica]